MSSIVKYSIVVPVYNEEEVIHENLPPSHRSDAFNERSLRASFRERRQ